MSQEPLPPAKQHIPPPVILTHPPPPPSPLESQAAPVVKVKIRGGDVGLPPAMVTTNTRIIAALIDMLVAAGITILGLLVLPDFLSKIVWLAGMAYMITRDSLSFLGGQSVGKKVMNIRVVTQDGQPLTGNWEKAAIRNAILVIPFLNLVELAVLLMRDNQSERGRRLGDDWAKTKVIPVVSALPEPDSLGDPKP